VVSQFFCDFSGFILMQGRVLVKNRTDGNFNLEHHGKVNEHYVKPEDFRGIPHSGYRFV
jgi:azurin